MKKLPCLAVAVAATLAFFSPARAQEHSRAYDNVKSQAADALKLLDAGNYAAYASCLTDTMLSQLGGPTAAPGAIKRTAEFMKTAGWKITRSVGEPSTPVNADGQEFAVVPTVITMESPTQKMVIKSYLVGVSANDGAAWKFADCQSIPEEGVRKWLAPGLPASVALPKQEEPEVTKK